MVSFFSATTLMVVRTGWLARESFNVISSGPAGHAVTVGPLEVVSCSSFAPMSARSATLETFPTWVRGRASMISRRSGHLYLARPSASK
jgi:hypothetical protein